VECWLQPFSIEPEEPLEYLETVPLGPWVQKLPPAQRRPFVAEVWRRANTTTIDYVRLNITAHRA